VARHQLLKPGVGYKGSHLWLPKSSIKNLRGIKASLTFERMGQAPIFAWEESRHHLIVPRAFIPVEEYPELDFDIIDLVVGDFPRTSYHMKSRLRDEVQHLSYLALVEDGSGILELACGKGKTVIALHAAQAVGLHTVVFVNEEGLARQWKTRILEHTDLREDQIGWIQGDKWDWEGKPITIALIQTVCSRIEEIPAGLIDQTGIVIYDEVHILGAPWFSQTAGMFKGLRWGLSATWKRSDGMEELYRYHMGPILYTNLEQDLIPQVFFVRTGVKLPKDKKKRKSLNDVNGELSSAKIMSWLAEHPKRNAIIHQLVDGAIERERILLALGERTGQLKMFHQHYPGSGLIIGDVKGGQREEELQERNPIFANARIAKQGLDRKDLNTILILYPFRDEGRFRQILGRALRACSSKCEKDGFPLIFVLEDEYIPIMVNLCRQLRGHLNALKYPYDIILEREL
jgi:superfamily II DNA or RNA helicase